MALASVIIWHFIVRSPCKCRFLLALVTLINAASFIGLLFRKGKRWENSLPWRTPIQWQWRDEAFYGCMNRALEVTTFPVCSVISCWYCYSHVNFHRMSQRSEHGTAPVHIERRSRPSNRHKMRESVTLAQWTAGSQCRVDIWAGIVKICQAVHIFTTEAQCHLSSSFNVGPNTSLMENARMHTSLMVCTASARWAQNGGPVC